MFWELAIVFANSRYHIARLPALDFSEDLL
jgi:hypothetical protein